MNKAIFNSGLIGVFAFFLFISFTACSYMDETASFSNEDSEIINYAEDFALAHNDCLDYCFKNLNSSTKASVIFASLEEFNSKIAELANSYVEARTTISLKSGSPFFTMETINSVTIADIRNQMNDTELFFIDRILAEKPDAKETFDKISSEVVLDKTLSDLQKKAVCSFITVYEKSSTYWQKNLQNWLTLKTTLVPNPITTRLAAWIAADCYWGWYGTVASGGNGIVGAGAAAVASACMAM